jgi:predicted alpha/beta superfamily hydrolase
LDNDQSPLAGTEVHYLRSSHVGAEFKIFVGHCEVVGTRPASVLYVTDANGYFGTAVDVIRGMQLACHLPSLLVVGIGYRAGALGETIPVRARDLTPSHDRAFAQLFPERAAGGGAANLLAFIRDELMPWVNSRYNVDPDDTTYFGHSLGGLFGTWVLLHKPATFKRYAIGSPSLWWDDGMIFRHEDSYAQHHDDLAAKVFFGIGADETQDGRAREAVNLPEEQRRIATAWYIDMVADMTRFVDRLDRRRYASLQLHHVVLPDEFHVTVAPLVLSRGLRYLYDSPH